MRQSRLLPIYLVALIDLIGFGIVIPILPFYAERFGATPWQVGLLFGCYSFFQFFFGPLLGYWSDRVGRRPVLILSLLGTSFAFFLTGFAGSLFVLFLARSIDGATGGNIGTAYAYLADVTEPEERTRAFGMLGAAFGIGFVIGPAIGGLLSHYSLSAPFIFAGTMALLNSLAVTLFLREPERHRKLPMSPMQFLESPLGAKLRALFAASFLFIFSLSVYQTSLALFTERRFHYGATMNGWLFAYIGILAALFQGGLLRRIPPRIAGWTLVITGSAFSIAGVLGLTVTRPGDGVFASLAAIALGMSLTTPVLSSTISTSAGPQLQGVTFGISQSLGSAARFFAPAIGTAMFARQNNSPFWISAVFTVLGCLAFLAFRSGNLHAQPSTADQANALQLEERD